MKKAKKVISIIVSVLMLMQIMMPAALAEAQKLSTPTGFKVAYEADGGMNVLSFNESTPTNYVEGYSFEMYALKDGLLLNPGHTTNCYEPAYEVEYLQEEYEWACNELGIDPASAKLVMRVFAESNNPSICENSDLSVYFDINGNIVPDSEIVYPYGGEAGDTSTWKISKDGTLIFSGTGEASAWIDSGSELENSIKKVVVEEGITSADPLYLPNAGEIYIYNSNFDVDNLYINMMENSPVVYAPIGSTVYNAVMENDAQGYETITLIDINDEGGSFRDIVGSTYSDAVKVISDLGVLTQPYLLRNKNVTKIQLAQAMIRFQSRGLFIDKGTSKYTDLEVNTFANGCANDWDTIILPESSTIYGPDVEITYQTVLDAITEARKYSQDTATIGIANKAATDKVTYAELALLLYQAFTPDMLIGREDVIYVFNGSAAIEYSEEDDGYIATLNGELAHEPGIAVTGEYFIDDFDLRSVQSDNDITLYLRGNGIVSGILSTYNKTTTGGGSGNNGSGGGSSTPGGNIPQTTPTPTPTPVSQFPTVFGWVNGEPGVFEYERVPGVTEYNFELLKNGECVMQFYDDLSGIGEEWTTFSDSLGRDLLDNGAGSYTVRFVAYDNLGDVVAASAECAPYNYAPSVTAQPLPTPTNLTYENESLSWSYSGAKTYEFKKDYSLITQSGDAHHLYWATITRNITSGQVTSGIDGGALPRYEEKMAELGLTTANSTLVVRVRAVPADIVNYTYSEYTDYVYVRGAALPDTAIASGTCGDSATWKLNDNGVLTISGTGSVTDASGYGEYQADITKLVIESGIEKIDDNMFYELYNLSEVSIADTVNSIGKGFLKGSSVTTVTLPISVLSVGEWLCTKCESLESLYVMNKNCVIEFDENAPLSPNATIYGYSNSSAHDLAVDNGNTFVALDPSFTINDGAEETNNKNVTIKFDENAVKNFKQYKIGDGEYQNIAGNTVSYTLDAADGIQRLAITFKNDYFESTAYNHITFNNKHKLTYKVLDKPYKEGEMVWENVEVGCGASIPRPTSMPYVHGYSFDGWDGIPADDKMPDNDLTINAKMTLLTTIKGKVLYNDAPAVGAKVTLPNMVVAITTDENGEFTVEYYPCGSFVANVEYNGMKTTVNVNATTAETDLGEIIVKELGTSTVITAPEVQAVTITDTEALLSDEDKTYLETPGNTIVIETKADVQLANVNISAEASTKYTEYMPGGIFLDLTVAKVKGGEATETAPITEANELIAFEIEIPQAIQGKSEYIILREHDGAVDLITKNRNADGEYLTVSGNVMTLYAKKFSVYSMYAKDAAPVYTGGGGGATSLSSFTVTFSSNGGSKVEPAKVKRNATVDEPAAPTKEGFVFGGWYTDKDCTKAYDFETKITKNFTLYAKWTEGEPDTKTIVLTIGEVAATIDGEAVTNDVAPIIVNERTMLPIRFIAEELGATVDWNPETKTVTITLDEINIVIVIDEAVAMVNDEEITLDSPAFIENDRTYLPLRFVMEELGADVQWDGEARTVTIVK